MKRDKVYYVGVHRYSFKSGVPAEIIGVEMITPERGEPRLCYRVQWADKVEDFMPIHDAGTYKIITFSDILAGNIPEATE